MKKILLLLVLVTNLVFSVTYEELDNALKKDDVSYIKNLIKTKELNMSLDDLVLETAKNNSKEVTELLLEKGANIEATNNEGLTALMRAASNNSKEMAELLIKKGANKNVRNSEGKGLLEIVDSDKMKEFLIVLGVK